jgi:predicted metal-dependent hydrolase
MEKEEAIRRAIQLFNDEKYWGAHEVLEGVWKSATGTEKEVLNGIILVAAAFVHDEKDEPEICLSILRRAIKKLDSGSNVYHGIDVDRFAALVSEIINSGRIERFTI